MILPGSTIGVIGGGQLGRMFALAAAEMSYKVAILDDDPDCPAAQVSAFHYTFKEYREFSRICDVVTYEFEHIDVEAVQSIETQVVLRPSSKILNIKNNRSNEKSFLKEKGFPVASFRIADNKSELIKFVSEMSLPLVVKTTIGGYDGKGQFYIMDNTGIAQLETPALPDQQFIIEEMIDYEKELSVIIARRSDGASSQFPIVANTHKNSILHITTFPAHVTTQISEAISKIAGDLSRELELEGLLAIELFLTKDGRVLINEIAPRPHNSGHYTMDACETSQFHQLLRSICDLPLGSTEMLSPAGMLNIVGTTIDSEAAEEILAIPGTHLHLYGKSEVRPGRKMGHINITGETEDEVEQKLQAVENIVYKGAS